MIFCAAPDAYASGSYLPVLMLLLIALGFGGAALLLSRYVGRRIDYPEKTTTYESGMEPRRDARERTPLKFYLIALLFILFDIEVVFLYPWALQARKLGLFGLVEMGIFLLLLLVGYFYILGSGALDWDRGHPLKSEAGEDAAPMDDAGGYNNG